jgi:uncharacterized membrane protein YphA (DoxX/SURF4 family)
MSLLLVFVLIFVGVAMLVHGVLKITGLVKEDISKDSDLDKKIFSARSRYFIGRYYAGFQAVIAGLGAIALGLIIYFSH